MKNVLLALLVTLTPAILLADEPVDLTRLPSPVQQAIKARKGQGEVQKVTTLRSGGSVRYVVNLKQGGDEKYLMVAPDGSVLNDENIGGGVGKQGKGKGKAKGHYKDKKNKNGSEDFNADESVAAPAAPVSAPSTPSSSVPDKKVESKSSSSTAKSAAEVRAEVTRATRRMNELDNNPVFAKAGLAAVAAETGVKLSTLQSQFTEFKVGTGGLLVCHEISKATGKPVKTLFNQRLQKRDWAQIAAENNFDLSTVLPKLQRVQLAMESAQTKKR